MAIDYVGGMKHEANISKPIADMSEDEFTAWLSALPPAPGIRHVDEDDGEADRRAFEDVAAGRVYPHDLVCEWLDTWGKPGRLPFGEWLANRDG